MQIYGNPWWDRYQPKSYAINTRSGDRTALKALTTECSKYGVDIVAGKSIIFLFTGFYVLTVVCILEY